MTFPRHDIVKLLLWHGTAEKETPQQTPAAVRRSEIRDEICAWLDDHSMMLTQMLNGVE